MTSQPAFAIHLTFVDDERPSHNIEYGDEPLQVAERAHWFAAMHHIKTVRVSMFHKDAWHAMPNVNAKLSKRDR